MTEKPTRVKVSLTFYVNFGGNLLGLEKYLIGSMIIGMRQYKITKYSLGADGEEQKMPEGNKKNIKYPPWISSFGQMN